MDDLHTTKLTYGPVDEPAREDWYAEITRLRAEREELIGDIEAFLSDHRNGLEPDAERFAPLLAKLEAGK